MLSFRVFGLGSTGSVAFEPVGEAAHHSGEFVVEKESGIP